MDSVSVGQAGSLSHANACSDREVYEQYRKLPEAVLDSEPIALDLG